MARAKKTATKPVVTKKVKKPVAHIDLTTDELIGDANEDVTLVTREGYEKLVQELEYLRNVKRREVAARIKEAISYGDLSENSEYEEAKNEQAFVEGRILELDKKVKNARFISDQRVARTVQIGTTVHLKNLGNGEKEVYTIVGSTEADPFEGRISNESPVGNALLECKKGDKIKVQVPVGAVEYEVVKLD